MKILILAPHTDDGELGCGGTIAKAIEDGAEVYYFAFSICEATVSTRWPSDVLEGELKRAIAKLGISPINLWIYRYPVRHFAEHRQEILEVLVKWQQALKPNVVFMPSLNDLHQDHHIIAQEGFRAFKKTTILAYEMPWNNLGFSAQLFVKLQQRHIDIKAAALKEYKSQTGKKYATEIFVKSLAHTRGVTIDADYAEAFEVVRGVIE